MSKNEESTFDILNKLNVSDRTETKGKFTYLSWVYSWSELKKIAPNATTEVYETEAGLPYFSDGDIGVMVKVGVTVDQLEHISYLPVMNFSNKAIKAKDVNMMDINKAIQRATVKAIGLHGLGLYIYAGEDLPEEETKKDSPLKTKVKGTEEKKAPPKKSGNSFRTSKKPTIEPKVTSEEEM